MPHKTIVRIAPTDQTLKRIRAIVYYGCEKYTQEQAERLCIVRKSRNININVAFSVAVIAESKRRYFNNYDFIEIIKLS